jgi:hypothetical protein
VFGQRVLATEIAKKKERREEKNEKEKLSNENDRRM